MSTLQLEERVAALEEEVARLKNSVAVPDTTPWWERIVGSFADDPIYDEAMRLGQEYRKSQPTAEELGPMTDGPS